MDLYEKCRGFYNSPEVAQKYGYPTNPQDGHQLRNVPLFHPH